ncbi:PIG-L deacetylase family protein [Streptomyces sp. H39-S7]|uniref:PIG-L deacetylase family protein n=1 Tax=Streptomyces sp. H39-S7 TaxID=3004357 RepID=UPI0022AF589A|nr:PIG-L family deacetylase [Streptomyces sp. H39-S7]MCZ4125410.1 PIG-L family deacetylase [Streptomyces sp. H39-S7]
MSLVLAVSPHLDDAVLSAGGRLFELAAEGAEVIVFTLLAGIPEPPFSLLADLFHEEWGLEGNPVAERRAEDGDALKLLGSRPVHGSDLDVIYRTGPDGLWMVDMDGPSAAYETDDEPGLREHLAGSVARVVAELGPDLILTCAAVGEHIDHRRTRDAVLTAAGDRVPVRCWEDLPYAHRSADPPILPDGAVLGPPVAERATDEGWSAKYAAIECYRSQHSMLWPSGEDFRPSFDAHATAQARSLGLTGRAELFWPVLPGGR